MTAPIWNLETLFPGGPASPVFLQNLAQIDARADLLTEQADGLPSLTPDTVGAWTEALLAAIDLKEACRVANIFASCHSSANSQCLDARRAVSTAAALASKVDRCWVPLERGVATSDGPGFGALVEDPAMADAVPRLHWLRRHRANLLPAAEAGLAVELGKDGIHAWNRLYSHVSGTLMVPLSDGREVSVSQAQNLSSSPDEAVRREAFSGRLAAWSSVAETCASALSHIVGTRLTLNRRRGVPTLADTLAKNRMSEGALDAMMEATRRARPLLQRYLQAKAHYLGRDALAWEDQSAPIGELGQTDWQSSISFIEEHFRSFSPELGDFMERAIRLRWVEAEDRAHKRPGGWCAAVPNPPGASRIFMTFGETFRSTVTLAHELGHGYHNHVLRDTSPARTHVPNTLAETASVFAENIVRDAALDAATTDAQRLAMLDARLYAGVAMLMNIPFRYELERALHEMRAQGEFQVAELNERTIEIQRRNYADTLTSWHPLFWAEKLHFYISSFDFYNYPYTFGYLFSNLVYQHAKRIGPTFLPHYDELLRQTAWRDAEPLARDFLGVELEDPETWMAAIAPLETDLEAFLEQVG